MLLSSGDKWRHERLWPFQWLGQAWPHFDTVASFSWRTFITIASHFPYFLHFLRLFSCFYEDLTVFWPPSWWLRWTRPLFWLVLVSSKFWTLWQFCKFVFASYVLQVIVWAYIKCCVWKCCQSIVFHGIFINYTNTIRQRSKLHFFLLIALQVS